MNLNKYTKAELISKIKKVDSRKDSTNIKMFQQNILNTITNYFSQIWELFLTFKNILLKLTLISLIIKIIKKYSMFRKLWWFINSIGLSIYGLFLLDNFAFDFITNFFKEIRIISSNIIDYFSNTQFYTYLSKLFNRNEIIEPSSETSNKIRSMIESNKTETIGSSKNLERSEGNSRISEWLKPQKDAFDDINDQVKTNDTNYNKYYIIAGIIVFACLTWVYADEIKDWYGYLIDWINSFRAGPPNNGGGGIGDTGGNIPTNNQKSVIDNIQNTPSNPDIELVDNSKGKNKLFTSPSLDDLNKTISDSWGETGSNSPGSTDSNETIKPTLSKTPLTSESSSSFNSNANITAIELAILNRVNKEWKEMCPESTQTKIKFIEENLKFNDDFFIRKQLVNYLANIEIEGWNISQRIKTSQKYLSEIEILQSKLIEHKLDKWITKHHNEIFNGNLKYK
jgi:hypothetical protein